MLVDGLLFGIDIVELVLSLVVLLCGKWILPDERDSIGPLKKPEITGILSYAITLQAPIARPNSKITKDREYAFPFSFGNSHCPQK